MAKKKGLKPNLYWVYVLVLATLFATIMFSNNEAEKKVNYTEFENLVSGGGVKQIIIYNRDNEAEAVLSDSLAEVVFKNEQVKPQKGIPAKVKTEIPSSDKFSDKIDQWKEAGVFKGDVTFEKGNDYSTWIWAFGPIILLVVFWIFMARRMGGGGSGGGIFNVGKSKAMLFDKDNANKVTFEDVAGLAEAKVEIAEIVDFLKNPKHYTELGGNCSAEKFPKAPCLSALLERVRPCSRKQWLAKRMCRSSPCRVPTS